MILMIAGGLLLVLLLAVLGLFAWGSSMPEAHHVTVSETIPAPLQEVYERLRKAEDYTRWRSGLKSVEVIDAGRWIENNDAGRMPLRVLEAAPPKLLVVKIDTDQLPFEGVWTYSPQEADGGTRVEITEDGRVKSAMFRALGRLFFPIDKTARTYLADLQRSFSNPR